MIGFVGLVKATDDAPRWLEMQQAVKLFENHAQPADSDDLPDDLGRMSALGAE